MKSEQTVKLQYLMLRFFERTISDDEFAVLNQSIKDSPAVQKLYFSYLKVYLAIKNARYIDKSAQSDLDLKDFLYELGKYEHLAPPITEELQAEEPVHREMLNFEKPRYRLNKSSFYTALAAIAAAVLIIATIYFLPPRVIPYPVARVLDSGRCEWTQGKSAKSRSILYEGSLEITKGTLKFAMYDGTEVALDAPAVIELEQIGQIYLNQGAMRATVPPVAAGFTVRTPSGSIVDYGTEFTVQVDTAGKTFVEVFRGIVELRDSSNPLIFKTAQKLTVGQKGQIDPQGKITWSEPEYHPNGEIRVQWNCQEETGRWTQPSFWAEGLVRGPELVSEFRAKEAPRTVLIEADMTGSDRIFARRADVGLLSRCPVTVRMTGGQVQFEQLWIGRMGQARTAEGRWIMSDGDLTLKGRDLTMLFIGDKCKGLMEINGGNVEIFGAARVGCNEGAGLFSESDGTLVMNGGTLTVYGIIGIAVAESTGTVYLNGGLVRAFDLRIEKRGSLLMTGGTLILEGDKTSVIQNLIDTGFIQSRGRSIRVEYDDRNRRGFGSDKTIVCLEE